MVATVPTKQQFYSEQKFTVKFVDFHWQLEKKSKHVEEISIKTNEKNYTIDTFIRVELAYSIRVLLFFYHKYAENGEMWAHVYTVV